MNVAYPRPSMFDGPALWTTTMPPPYAGSVSHAYGPQQALAYAPQPQVNRDFHPHGYYPAPQYSSPAAAAYYAQQQHQHLQQQHQQQQQHSRHAFAAPYPVQQQQQQSFGYESSGMAPPPPYQAQFGGFYHDQASRSHSRGRWPTGTTASWEGDRPVGAIGGGIWRDDSRDGRTYVNGRAELEHDHPSFDRPPHLSSGVAAVAPAPAPVVVASAPTSTEQQVEYNLIPNISPVPPPPTIERSAVPLADLAIEMVWEACALGVAFEESRSPSLQPRWANSSSKAPALFNEIASPRQEEARSPIQGLSSSPRTPELYGAIGDKRSRKISAMALDDGFGSDDDSSPGSSAPGTPAGVGAVEAAAARKQQLAGLGLGFSYDNKYGHNTSDDYGRSTGLDSPFEAIRTQARKLGGKAIPAVAPAPAAPVTSNAFPSEPTPAFRQFVKQVLTATLLAPEDLVLALYYVARIPSSSIIPPVKDQVNAASAIKAAPFKIILGALMLANKTLQDNSYRNETFATVSGIPLKDVNDLEVFVFGALGFDVAVREEVWRPWLDVVIERSRSRRGELGNRYEVEQALQRLVRSVVRHAASPLPGSPVLSPIAVTPSTPISNQKLLLADVNLDASGPLESPMQFDRSRYVYDSPCKKKVGFGISNTRSFGDELAMPNQLC